MNYHMVADKGIAVMSRADFATYARHVATGLRRSRNYGGRDVLFRSPFAVICASHFSFPVFRLLCVFICASHFSFAVPHFSFLIRRFPFAVCPHLCLACFVRRSSIFYFSFVVFRSRSSSFVRWPIGAISWNCEISRMNCEFVTCIGFQCADRC